MKVALPALALAAVLAFAGYSWLGALGLPALDLSNASIEDGKLVMANPKLDGFTGDNLPYSMNALRAVQDLGKTNLVRLEAVDARLPLGPSRWAQVKAPSGTFDNSAYAVTFSSEVSIATSDGISARLADARIDLASGNLVTQGPVEVSKQGSRISAQGLTVTQRGKTIVFEDRVRVTIDPASINLAQNGMGKTDAGSQ